MARTGTRHKNNPVYVTLMAMKPGDRVRVASEAIAKEFYAMGRYYGRHVSRRATNHGYVLTLHPFSQ